MDIQRYLLIAAIAALSFMLLIEWRNFDIESSAPLATAVKVDEDRSAPLDSGDDLPRAEGGVDNTAFDAPTSTTSGRFIHLRNDVLDLKIDLEGGDIVRAEMSKYLAELDSKKPFVLLENNDQRRFVAQSGLIGKNATDTADGRPLFSANNERYLLQEGSDEVVADLHYRYNDQIDIIKRYTLKRGEYLTRIEYLINNRSDKVFSASLFGQLKRDNSKDPGVTDDGMFAMKPFIGVAYSSPEDRYNKLAFEKMKDKPLKQKMEGGWIAVIQHYFLSAWVPEQDATNSYSTVVTRQGMNIARFTSSEKQIPAGETGKIATAVYIGPKDQYKLEEISPGLELTVDYGWLWWIAQPLFWLLTKLHSVIGNWGWSIIGVTILVKAAFFQLNAKAFTSMANMRKVQPKLVELKERYADDRQKQSQAMMELYKKEKINPVGGCLPMLVQMPVFIALYWVLMESVELRHAPFMLWIEDLSAMDPYFVLPLIMGVSMFIQQKLNPPPPDPMQAKVMQWMPVIFTFFFLFFPAGLVLYWVVNNSLSIVQQYIITKRIEKTGLPTR
ncbi:membrane protein insertase YidC [Spongiibacter sp. KMU-166]|uniref:Membrane protein insertase YidC n=1 Tax=Spongiibacter thalassae TaxID=2721624 RepID=A0ABX1GIV9_9GAMM|nr:membrane protein insertase YidC [Spongiibacter thalassae]